MNATLHNRRHFIKAAAVATASAPWISKFGATARAADPDRKLGFALCGLGSLSTYQIAPALQKTKYCRLAGIITGHPDKAAKWKAQYNIPDKNIYDYGNMDRMADNPDINVVYVVTPNSLHAEYTLKAAKAGKHVLSEKPMEVSVEKCQQMIDACKAANRLLAIGYRSRFDPHTIECIRLAREKTFGQTKIIEAGFGFRIGDPAQWRLKRDLAGGGALMDVGIYALQATRYLSGEEPVIVTALETKTDPVKFKEVDESITWQLKFPSGIIANCSTTYIISGIDSYTVFAEGGAFGLTRPIITKATPARAATAAASPSRRWTNSRRKWTILPNASAITGHPSFRARKACATSASPPPSTNPSAQARRSNWHSRP